MKRLISHLLLGATLLGSAVPAAADQITGVPTWRLQGHSDGLIRIWGVAPCPIEFDSMTTDASKARFWSMVLTAKASQKSMTVDYSNAAGRCLIQSFFMD